MFCGRSEFPVHRRKIADHSESRAGRRHGNAPLPRTGAAAAAVRQFVDIQKRILAELSELKSRAELRQLETVGGIDFSSNDYLGLATHPQLKRAVLKGLNSATRVASTGSRLLSGQDEAWTLIELDFARWVGAEAALYFTSGWAANVGLLSSLLRPEDIVFSDSANQNHKCEDIFSCNSAIISPQTFSPSACRAHTKPFHGD